MPNHVDIAGRNGIEAAREKHLPAPAAGNMTDLGLLGSLLMTWLQPAQAMALAGEWLDAHGGLRNLVAAARERTHDDSPGGLCMQALGFFAEIHARQLNEGLERGTVLTSPADTLEYLQHSLGGRRREIFRCMFLDTRHRVICHEDLFLGSIDGACVYPRVVAEHALRHNAAAVIVAHNHPSGVAEPSLADQAITRRLKDALSLLEIRLLDHLVIGEGQPVSMAERGML